jgi:23S rRNA (guanosine2251-2'-O)-methyltransferase
MTSPQRRRAPSPKARTAPSAVASRSPRPKVAPPNEAPASDRYIFGIHPVIESLRARPERIDRIFLVEGALNPRLAGELISRAAEARIRVERTERVRLTTLAQGGVHQGVVAEVREFDYLEFAALLEKAKAVEDALVVVLDGIQDPFNLGAIVRSAHAFGALGIVIPKDRAAGVTGVVAKASAGSIEHVPVSRVVNISRAIEDLKGAGFWTAAADPEGDRTLWQAQLDGRLALIIGSEGSGVRDGVLRHCDFRLRIPMQGAVASLNASVSAGVLLYEVHRQRAALPPPQH